MHDADGSGCRDRLVALGKPDAATAGATTVLPIPGPPPLISHRACPGHVRASIVVVGNELLAGHTQDANGPFLAGKLRKLGHRVVRITVVPDTIDEIVDALGEASEHAELVLVCGGLGPTRDDVTIDAVARFLHRPLTTPEPAKEQIRRIYRYGKREGLLESDEVDEDAWRMAEIPKGGTVVRNDEGAAPGSVHTIASSREGPGETVYVLPGPPAELQSVFSHIVERDLVPEGEDQTTHEVELDTFEAPVSSELDAFAEAHDEIEVGSYPQHGEKRVVVRLTGPEAAVEAAEKDLRSRLPELVLGVERER